MRGQLPRLAAIGDDLRRRATGRDVLAKDARHSGPVGRDRVAVLRP